MFPSDFFQPARLTCAYFAHGKTPSTSSNEFSLLLARNPLRQRHFQCHSETAVKESAAGFLANAHIFTITRGKNSLFSLESLRHEPSIIPFVLQNLEETSRLSELLFKNIFVINLSAPYNYFFRDWSWVIDYMCLNLAHNIIALIFLRL